MREDREMSVRMRAAMAEMLPCAAMVLMEGAIIALTIMASTAMSRGMSPFVFVVYTNALGSLILLPYTFFYHTDRYIYMYIYLLAIHINSTKLINAVIYIFTINFSDQKCQS